MATVAQLRRAVEKQGGTLSNESAGRYTVYQCEAPEGCRWSCSDIHAIKVDWRNGDPAAWRQAALADALERVGYGVEACDDEDCDYCHPDTEGE